MPQSTGETPKRVSLYTTHREKWRDGCGGPLCEGANKVVIARGRIPCDVLFIGEAPGVSEDVLGVPFVGPAGKLLDEITSRGVKEGLRIAYTNIVGCMPKNEEGRKQKDGLNPDEVIPCLPRVNEFVVIARPKLIVTVGATSQKWTGDGGRDSVKVPKGTRLDHILHPSYILQQNFVTRGMLVQQCVVVLQNATEDL